MYLMGILLFLYQGGIDTSIIPPLVTARKKNFKLFAYFYILGPF